MLSIGWKEDYGREKNKNMKAKEDKREHIHKTPWMLNIHWYTKVSI